MSATVDVPFTQNTAPVVEFRCLYTHDVRRKSKRWQDGFLKYHTFNKRIMLYDVPRNFVGDMHWKDQAGLHEGDEITLECAIMVQVNEQVDRTETDLTPLLKKKNKRPISSAQDLQDSSRHSTALSRTKQTPQPQKRHKSLHALLGEPRGPHGKAVLPTRSPYEVRSSDVENDLPEEHISKRRKINASVDRQQSLSTLQRNENRNKAASAWQARSKVSSVIEISSDAEHPSSDIWAPGPTMPPPPPLDKKKVQHQALHRKLPLRKTSAPTISLGAGRGTTNHRASARPSSPPVSINNKTSNVHRRLASPEPISTKDKQVSQPESPPGKPLKFAKKASRNKLMCQPVPRKRPPARIDVDDADLDGDGSSMTRHVANRAKILNKDPATKKTDRDRLQERIALIGKKKPHQYTNSSSNSLVVPAGEPYQPAAGEPDNANIIPSLPTDTFDISLTSLDQRVPPVSDPSPSSPHSDSESLDRLGHRADGKSRQGRDREKKAVAKGTLGPWSREAADLFDWRPPDREREAVDAR